jgi:branched-chain amino acid transport system substrate-binding protein
MCQVKSLQLIRPERIEHTKEARIMKREKWILVLVVFFGMILLNNDWPVCAQDKIKIGAINPLTGPAAKFGSAASKLQRTVIDDINKSGGVEVGGNKYLIDFREYDDESKNDKARAAMERLATVDKVVAVASSWRSPGALAIEPVAKMHKIATMTAGFTPRVNYEGTCVFRCNPTTLMDYYLPIKYVYENTNLRKLGVLTEEGDWGEDTKAFLKWWVNTYGGTIKELGQFPFNAKDFHGFITSIKAAKRKGEIDVLFFQTWASAMELFIKQAHATGLSKEIPIYAGLGAFDFISLKDVTPQIEGWNSVALTGLIAFIDDPKIRNIYSSESLAIYERYKAMGLTDTSSSAQSGYSQLMACFLAVKKAGTITDSAAVRNAMASLEFESLAGPIKMTNYGQPELTMKLVKSEIVNGKYHPNVLEVGRVPALFELPPKTFPKINVRK